MQTPPSLLDEFEYSGVWRIPDDQEDYVPGSLSYTPSNGPKLTLLTRVGAHQERIPVIHGITSENKLMTLIDSVYAGGRSMFGSESSISSKIYRSQYLIVGKHYNSLAAVSFEKIYVNFTNLEEWFGVRPFKFSPLTKGKKTEYQLSLRYAEPKRVNWIFDRPKLKITTSSDVQDMGDLWRSAGIERNAYFGIEATTRKKLVWYLESVHWIRILLTLFVGYPVIPRMIQGRDDSDSSGEGSSQRRLIDIYYPHSIPQAHDQIYPNEMVVPFSRIATSAERIFRSWFRNRNKFLLISSLYIGTELTPTISLEFTFLSLTQALESYHRVNFGKKLTLRNRLIYLLNSLPIDLKAVFPSNHEQHIDAIIETRNYLTHRDKSRTGKVLVRQDLYDACDYLRALIVAVITNSLGVDRTVIVKGLKESRRFRSVMESSFAMR